MKLNEFKICHPSARSKRQGNSITARNPRIRRLSENLTRPTGRQQGRTGSRQTHAPLAIHEAHPHATTSFDDGLDGQGVFQDANGRPTRHALPEYSANFTSRRVFGVQHAPDAVSPFAAEGRVSSWITIEGSSPFDEFDHVPPSFFDEDPDGSLVTETITRRERVSGVQCGRIIRAQRCGNAPLSVSGVAFSGLGFGEDNDVPVIKQLDRRTQSGDAAADNQEVALYIHRAYRIPGMPSH